MCKEADIVISGQKLTSGESMTIRVAVYQLDMDLCENGLGDHEHGKAMTAGYIQSIKSIYKKLHLTLK